VRELRSYDEEVEKEAAKTAAMKERGADPFDLKQQVEILSTNCSVPMSFISSRLEPMSFISSSTKFLSFPTSPLLSGL
jgi:hypothetical protein